jgi:cobalamin biosynthesis Mg chelatase CobN
MQVIESRSGDAVAKKKKMSKAQAAAARKEVTAQSVAKARSRETLEAARETQRRVQKEQSKSSRTMIIVGSIVVLAIFALAWMLTVGPGMLMGK